MVITVGVPRRCEDRYIASEFFADLLTDFEAQFKAAKDSNQSADAFIDLTQAVWIDHLPLVALALIVERLRFAKIRTIEIQLPRSETASGFLKLWGFIEFAQKHGCTIIAPPVIRDYSDTPRVLPLHAFSSRQQASSIRSLVTPTPENDTLRSLLRSAGFVHEHDVAGLANLVLHELALNAIEHAKVVPALAFAVAHVSNPSVKAAQRRNSHAAEWERALFDRIDHEGVTEIVVGDAGVGLVDSLKRAASAAGKRKPEDVAAWAFDAYSTSKEQLGQHTRGLWAVKEKIRHLRGVLFVGTGYDDGQHRLGFYWDFLNDPGQVAPKPVAMKADPEGAFRGCYFQILIPQRTSLNRLTYVACHVTTAKTPELRPVPVTIASSTDITSIQREARRLQADQVLFLDLSQTAEWPREMIGDLAEEVAREIAAAVNLGADRRIWLFNTPETVLSHLQTSTGVVELWAKRGVLLPMASVTKAEAPPSWRFALADPALNQSGDDGDTAEARRELQKAVSAAITEGSVVTDDLRHLTTDERTWVEEALSRNQAVVRFSTTGAVISLQPAFDFYGLSVAVSRILLPHDLLRELDEVLARQRERPRAWYHLPSRDYCEHYITRPTLQNFPYSLNSRIEKWMREQIARLDPRYAISFTAYAGELLKHALAVKPDVEAIRLQHYTDVHGKSGLDHLDERITEKKTTAVFLVEITGSGRTPEKVAARLLELGVNPHIICVVDTMSIAERRRRKTLARLRAMDAFHSLVDLPVDKLTQTEFDALPADDPRGEWPVIKIDPETLLPIRSARIAENLLNDGKFWRLIASANALSRNRITYGGQEIPTFIWLANILGDPAFADEIFSRLVAEKPDVIVLADDVSEALGGKKPSQLKGSPQKILRVQEAYAASLEGARVAVLCAAVSSGTGMARILDALVYATSVDVFIIINRMAPEVASAFMRQSRVTFHTFQWLSVSAPGSRRRFGRGEAARQLDEYRRSALSNRLIAFIDEKKDFLFRGDTMIESHTNLDSYDPLARPVTAELFRDGEIYTLEERRRSDLPALLGRAEPEDVEWIRHVLRESAARYNPPASEAPDDSYYAVVHRMLDAVGRAPRKVKIYQAVVEILLLERSVGRREEEANRPNTQLLSNAIWKRFLDLQGRGVPACASACLRAVTKLDARMLVECLSDAIRVACESRETELTLALELSKLSNKAEIEHELRRALQVMATPRSVGRQRHEVHLAVSGLFEDLGYTLHGGVATPIEWTERFKRLELELPDDSRVIRALIRSIHDRLPRARVFYFKSLDAETYILADSWPRTPGPPGSKPIFASTAKTLRAIGNEKWKYYQSVRKSAAEGDAGAVELVRLIKEKNADRSDLLARVERSSGALAGVLNVNLHRQGSDDGIDASERKTIAEMLARAQDLLSRAPFSISLKMAEWEYQTLITAGNREALLQDWADRVRGLLGGDLARLVVLDNHLWSSKIYSGDWTDIEEKEVDYPDNDTSYLTVRTTAERTPKAEADVQSRIGHAHPPTTWVHGCVCIPLVHQQEPCTASITLWHHTREWFDGLDPALLASIGRMGGALFRLTELSREIEAAKDATLKRVVNLTAQRVTTEVELALAHARHLVQMGLGNESTIEIQKILARIEPIVRGYREQKESIDVETAPGNVSDLLRTIERSHATVPRLRLRLILPPRDVHAPIDAVALRSAIAELIRFRSQSSLHTLQLKIELSNTPAGCSIRLSDDGPPISPDIQSVTSEAEPPENFPQGLLIARDVIHRHGGTLVFPSGCEILVHFGRSGESPP